MFVYCSKVVFCDRRRSATRCRRVGTLECAQNGDTSDGALKEPGCDEESAQEQARQDPPDWVVEMRVNVFVYSVAKAKAKKLGWRFAAPAAENGSKKFVLSF